MARIAAKKDKIDSALGMQWSESSVEKDLQTVLESVKHLYPIIISSAHTRKPT